MIKGVPYFRILRILPTEETDTVAAFAEAALDGVDRIPQKFWRQVNPAAKPIYRVYEIKDEDHTKAESQLLMISKEEMRQSLLAWFRDCGFPDIILPELLETFEKCLMKMSEQEMAKYFPDEIAAYLTSK